MVIRPQILASIGLLGVFWLLARKRLPKLRLPLMLHALAPLVLMMAFSAWRLHHHTGRHGLISENGTFNQVFGRCHNNKIFALPDNPNRRRTSFGPPPLIQLAKREAAMPDAWPGLDPALEDAPKGGVELEYRGYIGDADIHRDYIRRCIETTGWVKQLEYSLVNVLLLWRYNVMWPDSGKGGHWRESARRWGIVHSSGLAVPALFALMAVFLRRRADGLAIVSLHLYAIIIIAALILGGIRFRSPYDPIIILLAFEAYVTAAWFLWTQFRLRILRKGDDPARSGAVGDEASAKLGG